MHATPILSLAAIASLLSMTSAVCDSGAVGVAYRAEAQNEGGVGQFNQYSGSIVANDCNILVSNGITQNTNAWCDNTYDGGWSVDCGGGADPVTLTDSDGATWSCSDNTDTSCNEPGFTVDVCCARS